MATFYTTEENETLKVRQKENFYKNVCNFLNHTNNSTIDEITTSKLKNVTLIKRGGIPESHRMAADSIMIIAKVFGHPVIQCRLTQEEKDFLAKYDFNPLEFSTGKQIEEELILLKKWGNSRDIESQEISDKIICLRAKELKNLIATRYVSVTSEVYNGYKTLKKYFESISKYQLER